MGKTDNNKYVHGKDAASDDDVDDQDEQSERDGQVEVAIFNELLQSLQLVFLESLLHRVRLWRALRFLWAAAKENETAKSS